MHHGVNGGVYKAWAASERESRTLVNWLTKLQQELFEREDALRERIETARQARRSLKRRDNAERAKHGQGSLSTSQ